MRKAFIGLLILVLSAWAQYVFSAEPIQLARMNPYVAGGAGAASCSTPQGDVMSDGFEGCVADGSSGCDVTWTTTGTGLEYNYSLSDTPPVGACSKGLRVNSDGADYAYWNRGSGLATYWVKFSLYVGSEGLAAFDYGIIFTGSANSGGFGYGLILQAMDDATTGDGVIRLRLNNGTTSSTTTNINIQTWYTVEMCVTDGGETSNSCGEGNGVGWLRVNGGAKVTLACVDTGTYQYFIWGMLTASRTIDVIFGNVLIDDDGIYE